MDYHGRFEKQKEPKPKKKAGRIFLFVVLLLLVLLGGATAWGVSYYNNMMSKMNIVTLDENLYATYSEETTWQRKPRSPLLPRRRKR